MNFLMSLVVMIVIVAFIAVFVGRREFDAPGPATVARTFLVKPGQGTGQIAAGLEDEGIISDSVIFQLGYRTYGGEETMKAGEYEIKPGMSMREVMQLLQSGKSIMYSLTDAGGPDRRTGVQADRRRASAERCHADTMSARGQPCRGYTAVYARRRSEKHHREDAVAAERADQRGLGEAFARICRSTTSTSS